MTGSTETSWREPSLDQQVKALDRERAFVSCPAPLDAGGLGRHLREILDAHERAGLSNAHLCTSSERLPPLTASGRVRSAAATPLARVSRAWRMWSLSVDFDERAARAVPADAGEVIAFNGTAGTQFQAAQARAKDARLTLVSANSHYDTLVERHAFAHRQYPVERPWVTHLRKRNLREYAIASRILYSSSYIRDSFLAQGVAEDRLVAFPLTPHPRYVPRVAPAGDEFEVVYVGSLTVHKGVPLLLDAFSRLRHDDIRLVLVGGWGTRGMRRHVESAIAADPRISISPGDPRVRFADAHLCVHPAYEDGFGYAPAEALASGVPVIVSADTGMKELVDEGRDGVVLPTGDRDALCEAIEAAYEGRLLDGP
jgi:glycosyltransferase involved in cell wall biosynthesis